MPEDNPCVFVVDDDRSIRDSLSHLIRSMGLNVQTFASAQAFLTSPRPDAPSCLVLDVQLPGFSGLDLQRELAKVECADSHYLHHRSRRHSDDGARHESRGHRIPHETVPRRRPAPRHRAGDQPRPPAEAMQATSRPTRHRTVKTSSAATAVSRRSWGTVRRCAASSPRSRPWPPPMRPCSSLARRGREKK